VVLVTPCNVVRFVLWGKGAERERERERERECKCADWNVESSGLSIVSACSVIGDVYA
jgi:hypothetical protein